MLSKKHIALIIPIGLLILSMRCSNKRSDVTSFTPIDSITDVYLVLQDSLLVAWNLMITDDNRKIAAMEDLVHELETTQRISHQTAQSLDYRTAQLMRIRYTSKTMSNSDVVEEYDFASSSLATELVSLAESCPDFSTNKTMQRLVENIRTAELRVERFRVEYDAMAFAFNSFLEEYNTILSETDSSQPLNKKPLFQMASE